VLELTVMATKLHEFKTRDEALAALIEASKTHPYAEMREDTHTPLYTVWDGAETGPREGQGGGGAVELPTLDDAQMAKLADMIAARMKGQV